MSMSTARWLFGLSLLGFSLLTLSLAVGASVVATVDHHVLLWGYRATDGFPVRTAWWLAVARYGAPLVLRLVILVLAIVEATKRRWQVAAWLVGVDVAENLLAPAAKLLLTRPRPHWLHPIAVEHSLSFPSGHAAGAGMFVTVTVLLTRMTVSSRPLRLTVLALVTAVGVAICLDRVLLGVHYLSDVVGGVLLGTLIATAGWQVLLRYRPDQVGASGPSPARATEDGPEERGGIRREALGG
ncbi:MAG TPA: phosphatase PAP2 family protein [Marmoricola sp.]|nr:phosphatase PAP2 family protein [Marmoricola sp.]